MKSSQTHLSDEDLMSLLQEIHDHNSFLNSLKNILFKKKLNTKESCHQHLLNCQECVYELWDTYLSLEAVLDIQKVNTSPKLRLSFDSLRNSFQAQLKEGFLLLEHFTPAISVRSGQEKKSDYFTNAEYLSIIPKFDNLLVKFKIKSTVSGIQFSIYLKNCSGPFLCSFYHNDELKESQNISESHKKADFFLHYDDSGSKVSLSFTLQKGPESKAYKFVNLFI